MRRRRLSLVLGAAVTGLLAGSTLLPSCARSSDAAGAHRNGCSGPNGCGGAEAKKETNKCSGPNGCNAAHATKEKEANKCSGPNGCNAAEKK